MRNIQKISVQWDQSKQNDCTEILTQRQSTHCESTWDTEADLMFPPTHTPPDWEDWAHIKSLPALYVCKKGEKFALNQTEIKKVLMTDLGWLRFLYVKIITHNDISQFTFDPCTAVAQDMTQSWPSQQALGGDQAQRILYNPKVCGRVCCSAFIIKAKLHWGVLLNMWKKVL